MLSLGNHVITFTASDAVTNVSTCTLTLAVIDKPCADDPGGGRPTRP